MATRPKTTTAAPVDTLIETTTAENAPPETLIPATKMPTAPDDQFAEYLASSQKSARLQALAVLFASHNARGWNREDCLEKAAGDLAAIESLEG